MGNPQGKLLSVEFLAGLIAGEGCFTIGVRRLTNRVGRKHWLRLDPIFSMSMADIETMELVVESLRHHGLHVYARRTVPRSNGREMSEVLNIQSTGLKRVYGYASLFSPLLTGKKRQAAEVVLRFCKRRLSRENKGIDEDDLRDVDEIRSINARNGGNKYAISDLRDYMGGREVRGSKRDCPV